MFGKKNVLTYRPEEFESQMSPSQLNQEQSVRSSMQKQGLVQTGPLTALMNWVDTQANEWILKLKGHKDVKGSAEFQSFLDAAMRTTPKVKSAIAIGIILVIYTQPLLLLIIPLMLANPISLSVFAFLYFFLKGDTRSLQKLADTLNKRNVTDNQEGNAIRKRD